MSGIDKLIGKGKKIKVGDLDIEIKPLSLSDMDMMVKLGDEKTRSEATKELITKVIKESVPDATEEQIEKIDLKYVSKIMETIIEINQLGDVGNKDFLEKIKKRQNVRRTSESGDKKAE